MIVGPKTKLILQRSVSGTDDGMGGYEYTSINKKEYSGVLASNTTTYAMVGDKVVLSSTHKFYMEYPKDNLVPFVGEHLTLGTRTFRVDGIRNPNNRNTHLELDLSEDQ